MIKKVSLLTVLVFINTYAIESAWALPKYDLATGKSEATGGSYVDLGDDRRVFVDPSRRADGACCVDNDPKEKK